MASEEAMSGENGKGAGESAQTSGDIESLRGELDSLKSAYRELERRQAAQDDTLLSPEYLDFLASKEGPKSATETQTIQSEQDLGEIDFDSMSPKELYDQIVKDINTGYQKSLDQARSEVGQNLSELTKAHAIAQVQHDLEITKIKHPDLDQRLRDDEGYLDQFYRKAQENPNWRAERVYKEVERDLKDAIDTKAVEESKRARAELDATVERGGVPSSTSTPRELSSEEAASLAFDKHMASKGE